MSKNNKNTKRHKLRKIVNTFPCKDCLTRPLCTNRYRELQKESVTFCINGIIRSNNEVYIIDEIIRNCSILREYINGPLSKALEKETKKLLPCAKSLDTYNKNKNKSIERKMLANNFFISRDVNLFLDKNSNNKRRQDEAKQRRRSSKYSGFIIDCE